eukprot:487661-Hanusia_phi.AAC.1
MTCPSSDRTPPARPGGPGGAERRRGPAPGGLTQARGCRPGSTLSEPRRADPSDHTTGHAGTAAAH